MRTLSLADAVALIPDGASLMIGGFMAVGTPESMVDELLSSFQTELFASYDEILATHADARDRIDAIVRASFDAIDQHHEEVAIFQNDAAHLQQLERFAYLGEHNRRFRELWVELLDEGVRSGALRGQKAGQARRYAFRRS